MIKLQLLAQRLEAFTHAPSRTKLVYGALGALLFSFASGLVSDSIRDALWAPIRDSFLALMAMPMRVGGWIVVLTLAGSIVLALVDTSPTAAAISDVLKSLRKPSAKAAGPVQTAEDRDLIQPVRAWWIADGQSAADFLDTLMHAVLREDRTDAQKAALHWVDSLFGLHTDYQKARVALIGAVEYDSKLSFKEVRTRLDVFCIEYFRCGVWLARINESATKLTEEPYARPLERWQRANAKFRRTLARDIGLRPEHVGQLHIELNFHPDYIHTFLNTEAIR